MYHLPALAQRWSSPRSNSIWGDIVDQRNLIALFALRARGAIFENLLGQAVDAHLSEASLLKEDWCAREDEHFGNVQLSSKLQEVADEALANPATLRIWVNAERADFGKLRRVNPQCCATDHFAIKYSNAEIKNRLHDVFAAAWEIFTVLGPMINEPGNGVKIISARLAELNFTRNLVRNRAFAQHATHAHDGVFNGA
jgi:hypothetical protein